MKSISAYSLLLLATSVPSAFALKTLSLTLSESTSFLSADILRLNVTLSNTGDETLNLLNDPNSVLTPKWKTNVFSIISKSGVSAKFSNGVTVKWEPSAAVASGDITVLLPKQSITLTHQLDGVYNFTASGSGLYDITAKTQFYNALPGGQFAEIQAAQKAPLTIWLWGNPTPSSSRIPFPGRPSLRKRQTYVGCSASQQASITTGASATNSYISSANSYLAALTYGTQRWTTWFGTYTAQRHTSVKSRFLSMNGDPSTLTYDCTCTEPNVYAYTYPDQPNKMYLCGGFWTLPTTGVTSKASVIFTQNSKWSHNGGSQDFVYGESACKALAITSPDMAIFNTESLWRFAVNTPTLP